MSDILRGDKEAMRAAMRARRSAVSSVDARHAGERAALVLARHLASQGLRRVLLYASLPGEVDTLPVDLLLRRMGLAIAYPRVHGQGRARLSLHLATPDQLRAGHFGVREPTPDAPEPPPDALDALVLPGLAFDLGGGRLGFGGGYFDTLLARARRPLRYGLCHPFQLVPHVPVEAHDVRLDFIVCDRLHPTRARPVPEPLPTACPKEETP